MLRALVVGNGPTAAKPLGLSLRMHLGGFPDAKAFQDRAHHFRDTTSRSPESEGGWGGFSVGWSASLCCVVMSMFWFFLA